MAEENVETGVDQQIGLALDEYVKRATEKYGFRPFDTSDSFSLSRGFIEITDSGDPNAIVTEVLLVGRTGRLPGTQVVVRANGLVYPFAPDFVATGHWVSNSLTNGI